MIRVITVMFSCLISFSFTTDPVFLFHGVTENHTNLDILAGRISEDFPGTLVHSIKMFPNLLSVSPLKFQSKLLTKYIQKQGVRSNITLIGHSQGALILRHMIQNWDNHNIATFISVAGPHMGVSKIPPTKTQDYHWLPNSTIAEICYNSLGQKLSFCNMWNDPLRQAVYKKQNNFLPESLCQSLDQKNSCTGDENLRQAANLNRLKKLVLIATPDDGTIFPFESALFGYYDENWKIVPREKQEFYNSLGLESLEKSQKLVQCVSPGVGHQELVNDKDVYNNCIKPHIS